jgi:hypothetical protein
MTEIVVAAFPTGQAAEAAMLDLEAAGIPADSMRRHRDANAIPSQHRSTYERALSAGGTVLTVPVEQAHAERVIAILHGHGPVEVDEQQARSGTSSQQADQPARVRRFRLDDDTGRVW